MTTFSRLLTLMICFEFILAPMKLSLLKMSVAQADERCPTPGTAWSENNNRCLTTPEQAALRQQLDRCKNMTGDERKNCLEQNARNAGDNANTANGGGVNNPNSIGLTNPNAGAGDVITGGDGISAVTRGAALVVPIFFMANTLSTGQSLLDCTPPSLMLLYGGSLVLLAGEVITYFTHTGALRKLETDWKEKSKQDESGKVAMKDTQSEAFGFLAANEGVKKDTSTYKAAYYAGSAALFAAGMVAAAIEMFDLGKAQATVALGGTDAPAAQQEINRITCSTTKIPEEKKDPKSEDAKSEDKAKANEHNKNFCEAHTGGSAEGMKNCMDSFDKPSAEQKQKDLDERAAQEEKAARRQDTSDRRANGERIPLNESDAAQDKRMNDESVRKLHEAQGYSSSEPEKPTYENQEEKFKEADKELEKIKADQAREEAARRQQEAQWKAEAEASKKNEVQKALEGACGVNAAGEKFCIPAGSGGGGKPKYNYIENPFEKDIQPLLKLKTKKLAMKNIATATDSFNLIELLTELKNIEFENYSKTSYLAVDENTKPLKENKLSAEVTNVISQILLMKEAHAWSEEDDGGSYYPSNSTTTTPPDSTPPPRAMPTVDEVHRREQLRQEKIAADRENPPPVPSETKDYAVDIPKILGQGASLVKTGKEMMNTVKGGPLADQAEVKKADDTAKKTFSDVVHQPWFRLTVNGVMGAWSGVITGFLVDQANKYAKRQELLNSMKDNFNSVSGIMDCSDDDRRDPSKPNCYCFTAESKRNEARSNSRVCKALFGTGPNYGSTDYSRLSSTPTCVNKNQAVDAKCTCKQTNSCARVSVSSGGGVNINPGTFRTIGMGTGLGNDLLGGRTSAGNVSIGNALGNAARIRAAAMKALTPAQVKKMEAAGAKLEKSLLDATKNMSMPSGGSGAMGNSDLSKMTPAQAAAALQKEFKENKEKSKDVVAAPTYGQPGAAKEQLEFGMTQADLAAQETEVAEVMKQKLDFNQNDINNASKQNIFEVLSNRYQRSGMRRLFDESGKSKPEKANADDINK